MKTPQEITQYTILLQNLFNRATEIEIHNAALGKREVSLENIEKHLAEVGKIVSTKINKFKTL